MDILGQIAGMVVAIFRERWYYINDTFWDMYLSTAYTLGKNWYQRILRRFALGPFFVFGHFFKPAIWFVYGCIERDGVMYGLGKVASLYGLQLENTSAR